MKASSKKIVDYFQRHLVTLANCVLDMHSGSRTLDCAPFAAIHVLRDGDQQARC